MGVQTLKFYAYSFDTITIVHREATPPSDNHQLYPNESLRLKRVDHMYKHSISKPSFPLTPRGVRALRPFFALA